MDIEVNYKNKKRYNTAKTPLHQNFFWKGLIWLPSKIMLTGKRYKIEKVNMEGLQAPYMMLSNHMHFIDFELAAMGTEAGSHPGGGRGVRLCGCGGGLFHAQAVDIL